MTTVTRDFTGPGLPAYVTDFGGCSIVSDRLRTTAAPAAFGGGAVDALVIPWSSGVEQWLQWDVTVVSTSMWANGYVVNNDVGTDGFAVALDPGLDRLLINHEGVGVVDTFAMTVDPGTYRVVAHVVYGASGVGVLEAKAWNLSGGSDPGTYQVGGAMATTVTGTLLDGVVLGGFNGAGSSQYQEFDTLSVTDVDPSGATVPAAITDLTATPGNGEVVLTHTAPADNGDAITDYEYQYRVAEDTDPPSIASSTGEVGTSLGSNNAQPLPSGAAAGDLILAFVSNDNPGATDPSGSTGWAASAVHTQGSTVKARMFARVLDGTTGDNILSVSGASQDYAIALLRISAAEHDLTNATLAAWMTSHFAFALSGGSSHANPPDLSGLPSKKYLFLAVGMVDGTTGFSVVSPPDGYAMVQNLLSVASGSSSIVATAVAAKTVTSPTTSENPGAFTQSGSRTWISYTVAIPQREVAWSTFSDGTSSTPGTTVTGLTNGTEYEFRARAVNGIGAGAWSNVDSATPTAGSTPGAPTAVRLGRADGTDDAFGYNSQMGAEWTAPASDGGSAITGYAIATSTNDGSSWSTYDADTGSSTPSVVLTGLTLDTRYLVRVAAINAIGQGPWAVSEWGCTPIAATAPLTPPAATNQSSAEWHLARIDQRALPHGTTYSYRYTGSGVRIYVVDTGIRATHEQFDSLTFLPGFSVGITDEYADLGHGAVITSMMAGDTLGVAKDPTIVSLKTFDDDHSPLVPYPDEDDLLACLDWILTNHPGGPAIVNLSLAFSPTSDPTRQATISAKVTDLIDAGIVCVQSYGNESGPPDDYTATAQPGLIIVAGSADDDSIAVNTTLGPSADLFAPCEGITHANASSDTAYDVDATGGTSLSCAIVTGVLALWLEANPTLTPRQLQDLARAWSTKDVITGSLLGSPNRLIYTLVDIPPAPDPVVADGTIGSIVVHGIQGALALSPLNLDGTIGEVAVLGTAGSLALSALNLDGTIGELAVLGTAGQLTLATVINGIIGTINVAGVDGSLLPTISFDGTPGEIAVLGVAGSLVLGSLALDGTPGVIETTGIDGSFNVASVLSGTPGVIDLGGVDGAIALEALGINGAVGQIFTDGIDGSLFRSSLDLNGTIGEIALLGLDGELYRAPATFDGTPGAINLVGVDGSLSLAGLAIDGDPGLIYVDGRPGLLIGSSGGLEGTVGQILVLGVQGELVVAKVLGGGIGPIVVHGIDGTIDLGPLALNGGVGPIELSGINGDLGVVTVLAGALGIIRVLGVQGALDTGELTGIPLYLGGQQVVRAYVGGKLVVAAYLGSEQLF